MRFIGKGALALLSALVVVGVMAGTAFASLENEWEQIKITPAPVRFVGVTNNVKFTSAKGSLWECERGEIIGEFFNSNEAHVNVIYKYCGGLGKGGEFSSTPLLGKIGWTKGSSGEVALRLEPAEGSIWAENFSFSAPLTGKIFGYLSPKNTKTSKFTLLYQANGAEQGLRKFYGSGQPPAQLEYLGEDVGVKAEWHIETLEGKQVIIEHS